MKWVLIFVLWAFSSCDLNRFSQYSIISPDDIKDISADEFFYVNIESAYAEKSGSDPLSFLIYAMDDGPGTDCKIPVNKEDSEDLFCILDIMEGDLWLHEINLKYNVPPGMCSYLTFLPHWHYNKKGGFGPPYVAQYPTEVSNDNGKTTEIHYVGCKVTPKNRTATCSHNECTSQTDCGDASHPCNGAFCSKDGSRLSRCTSQEDCTSAHTCNNQSAGTWTAGTAGEWSPTLSICPGSEQYEKSNRDYKKLCPYTCCIGEYILYENGKIKEEDQEWAEDQEFKKCIGGLAKLSEPKGFEGDFFNKEGFPFTLIKESGSKRVDGSYTLPPLYKNIDQSNRVSFPTANFFKAIEDNKDTTENALTLGSPDFYKRPGPFTTWVNGKVEKDKVYLDKPGNPFLTWSCLDNAKETKHRIHLLIREWNTQEEFNDFKEGGNGDPDTGGTEGNDCDYYQNNDDNFSECNDLQDADDPRGKQRYPNIKYNDDPDEDDGGSSDR